MLRLDADIVLSATDLTNFLACPRLSQEQLRAALGLRGRLPRDEGPHADLLSERGERYEEEQLLRLSAAAGGHEEVALAGYSRQELERAADLTAEHMRAGVPLVYQAVFFDGRWQGRVDFLRKVRGESLLGDYAYEVVDTKLARSVKPAVVHQLSLYARLVARIQGRAADRAFILLGDGTEEPVELRRYAALHRHVVARLEALAGQPPVDVYPEPVAHCALCRLERECLERRRRDDHLSFVAGARRSHRDALTAGGVATLEALATLPGGASVPDVAGERLEILHGQAALQRRSRISGRPEHRHLPAERERGYARLPDPSPGDVFFDFEGDPYVGEEGIEYLWGWTTADGTYHHLWAHDDAQEREALRRFLDWIERRRAEHPGLHVFHYGAHEASKLKSLAQRHGTGEGIVDAWLRAGVLVDLYAVVRQAMQVGEESYSLKRLERHYGFVREEHSVRDGGGSIVAYEAWLEAREESLLEAIRAYNAEDCLSTAALYRWLFERMRPAAGVELEADFEELARPEAEEPPREPAFMAELRPVLDGLARVADTERELLANLLLYHYRESKPQYWHWFAMREMTPDALVDEREALGMLTLDASVAPVPDKRSLRWTFRFPAQECKIEAGRVFEPFTQKQWEIVELDETSLVLKRGKDKPPPDVRALIPQSPPDGGKVREAVTAVARAALSEPQRFAAVRALLRREAPAFDVASCGPGVDDLVAATLALGESYLAVQGPPGTGKTFRGAHMAVAALRAGRRVAVTANSHAAIQNFLRAVEDRALSEGVTGWRGVYKGAGYVSAHGLVEGVEKAGETFADADGRPFDLVAGTAWLMGCEQHREAFDLLFVDEAGQCALANAVAAGTVARGIVLLGDPQQLPQVNQAAHPAGAGESVLGHLLGDGDVIAGDHGVFLDTSFRMHPDVCAFVSERSYDRELRSTAACARRRVDAPGRLSGAGLRAVAVEHQSCSQESVAEAEAIGDLCRELLDGSATVTDDEGTVAPLRASDILVVAPYNLAHRCIEARVPTSVRVGTVDKFQGQEAPVVFFAMTCSSGEDVPRGLDFLFDRNRLNVAISRARCLAVLVHAPRLLDADCKSLEQMRLVDGACRFVEMAEPVSARARARAAAGVTLR